MESLSLDPEMQISENELDLKQVFQMAEQIFGLLWPLVYFSKIKVVSEISRDALELGIELISHMLFFFSKDTGAPQITREVMGQVILLCVEENHPTSQICQVMKSVLDDSSEPITLRVLAASILVSQSSEHYHILSVLASCLNQDWNSWMIQANQLGTTLGPVI